MKSWIYVLFFGIMTINLLAQPVITEDIIPEVGENWTRFGYFIDSIPNIAELKGRNQIWDLSMINDMLEYDLEERIESVRSDPFYNYSITRTEGILFADSFPNADFAIVRSYDDVDYKRCYYQFITSQNAGISKLGEVDIFHSKYNPVIMDTALRIKPTPQLLMPLPFTFGDSFTREDRKIEENQSINRITETITRDSILADGYGTLILPFHTYQNTIRYTIYQTKELISRRLSTGEQLLSFTKSMIYHEWYIPDLMVPVMTYLFPSSYVDDIIGEISFNIRNDNIISSTHRHEDINLTLKVTPNPAKVKLELEFILDQVNRQVNAYLFDLQGRLVKCQHLGTLPSGQHNATLHLPSGLSTGIYTLKMIGEGFIGQQKVMIGH